MIDIKALCRYLLQYWWVLVFVPLITCIITFFFVKDMPNSYTSEARVLATSSLVSINDPVAARQYNYFAEMVLSKPIINVLSYRLMIHDLEHRDGSFTEWSDGVIGLSEAERSEVIEAFKIRLQERRIMSPADNQGKMKLFDLLASMGYYEFDLRKSIYVTKNDITGFIDVAFQSKDQNLSVFAVNALVDDFVDHYNTHLSSTNDHTRSALDSVLSEKRLNLRDAESKLNAYKVSRGVTGIGEQSGSLYERVGNYEQNLAENRRQIDATKGAILGIDQKIRQQEAAAGKSQNSDVVLLDQELKLANERYVDGGFKLADKQVVDSLKTIRRTKLAAAGASSLDNSREIRMELLNQRRTLETQLTMLENSTSAIQSELGSLKGRFERAMPADTELQRLQQELDAALNEYSEAAGRMNSVGEQGLASWRLNVAMHGLPGVPESSKMIMYVGGAGLATTSLCFAVLFLLFILDKSVKDIDEFEKYTGGQPTIGQISYLPGSEREIDKIWENSEKDKRFDLVKDQIRAIRFEVRRQLDQKEGKILMVSSVKESDGKSFVAASLAYAFAISGSRVLLIGNEVDRTADMLLDENKQIPENFNRFLTHRKITANELITFLKTNQSNRSLMELDNVEGLKTSFEILKQEFDIIIVDGSDFSKANELKEWMYFSDASISIFSAGTVIDDHMKKRIAMMKEKSGFLGWIFNRSSQAS